MNIESVNKLIEVVPGFSGIEMPVYAHAFIAEIILNDADVYGFIVLISFLAFAVLFLLNKSNKRRKVNELITEQSQALKKESRKVQQSMEYAKSIQDSFLNREGCLKKHFEKSALFHKTKDVVSGDLFFVDERGEEIVLITIDCSGHGVPGAFMSLIAHQSLKKIMGYEEALEPNDILYSLHQEVMQALGKNVNTDFSKDGMDVSVCVINKKENTLKFSGARTSIFLVRSKHLIELKGNLLSIGGMFDSYIKDKEIFTCEQVKLEMGDQLVMFTDGITDQFGGETGKKLNKQGLKNMLQNYKGSIDEFGSYSSVFMQEWMNGKNPQLDDMMMLRVEI